MLGRCLLIVCCCCGPALRGRGRGNRCHRPHRAGAGPGRARAAGRAAGRRAAGGPRARPDAGLAVAPARQRARFAAARAAKLPQVPRLTGRDDVTDEDPGAEAGPDPGLRHRVAALRRPGAERRSSDTGVPTILLDGSLAEIPHVLRIARAASCIARAVPKPWRPSPRRCWRCRQPTRRHPRVLYARGADGLTVAAPGTDVTEVFTRLGWQVLAPDGPGDIPPLQHRRDPRARPGPADLLRSRHARAPSCMAMHGERARGARGARARRPGPAVRLGRGTALDQPPARPRLARGPRSGDPRGRCSTRSSMAAR